MKATGQAPSNIAFIKYWGKKDEDLRLPENGSISMNLSNLLTTTTVEFDLKYKDDQIFINDDLDYLMASRRVIAHLDRIRSKAKIKEKARVVSKNNFPSRTGLSSSASGFAALTVAAASAAGLKLSEKELSVLARLGSGSACRSIPDGFTEWMAGNSSETSYAIPLYPPDYWDIVDIVGVVSKDKKEVGSTEGQKLAGSSPFYPLRLSKMSNKIKMLKKYLLDKNFTKFGELVEAEALEMHAIMMTSIPSLLYIMPESLKIMRLVRKWRSVGLEVYFTLNTGQDIHLICRQENVRMIYQLLSEVPEVKQILVNKPAKGARLISRHLF
jgi:diphosphomevalonate decarboxylase